MEVAKSGQRKNEHIFHPTHLPSIQSSYACLPPPPPVFSFIVFSCRLQTSSVVLFYLCWKEGRCAILVGWMSRGSTWILSSAFIGSWPKSNTFHRYGCGCLKLRALRLYTTAYWTSTKTQVCQYLLVIVNRPYFLLSFLVCPLLPAHWKCRSDYTPSNYIYKIRRLLGTRDRPVAETSARKHKGFEPAIPASGRQQTHALDRAVTGIGPNHHQ